MATTSMSLRFVEARNTKRPIRPNPLIPILVIVNKNKLVIYSDEDDQKINISNGEDLDISIKNKRQIRFFSFNLKNSKIVLYLPQGYEKEFDIESDYGNIKVG